MLMSTGFLGQSHRALPSPLLSKTCAFTSAGYGPGYSSTSIVNHRRQFGSMAAIPRGHTGYPGNTRKLSRTSRATSAAGSPCKRPNASTTTATSYRASLSAFPF